MVVILPRRPWAVAAVVHRRRPSRRATGSERVVRSTSLDTREAICSSPVGADGFASERLGEGQAHRLGAKFLAADGRGWQVPRQWIARALCSKQTSECLETAWRCLATRRMHGMSVVSIDTVPA